MIGGKLFIDFDLSVLFIVSSKMKCAGYLVILLVTFCTLSLAQSTKQHQPHYGHEVCFILKVNLHRHGFFGVGSNVGNIVILGKLIELLFQNKTNCWPELN